jgi:phenylacetate-CoA ligase
MDPILCLPRDELQKRQGERLAGMVAYVYDRAAFWRRKLDEAGVGPDDIRTAADIRRLGTCTKDELREDQREAPPFGTYACTPTSEWARSFFTSGTDGDPLRRGFSRADWRLILGWSSRLPAPCRGDALLLTRPADCNLAMATFADRHRRRGATVLDMGTASVRENATAIAEFGPTKVAGPRSYLLHLTEVAASRGIDLGSCGVRTILSGLEHPAAVESSRLLGDRFRAPVIDCYAPPELLPMGTNCPFSDDLHVHEDLVLVEALHPDADEPVPPGELGELTYTSLVGDTQPLLRYRSGDMGVLGDSSPCACGSTHRRIVGLEEMPRPGSDRAVSSTTSGL